MLLCYIMCEIACVHVFITFVWYVYQKPYTLATLITSNYLIIHINV
jgi:hypothetical protein